MVYITHASGRGRSCVTIHKYFWELARLPTDSEGAPLHQTEEGKKCPEPAPSAHEADGAPAVNYRKVMTACV